MDASVEKILSLWIIVVFELGRDVDKRSNSIPSGRITDICKSGEPEYLAVNS